MWKQIPNFPDYEITKDGKVRSYRRGKPKELKANYPCGYPTVGIYPPGKKSKRVHRLVHRLVWETFVGPIPEGLLELNIVFGVSNRASDIDNPLKPFLDILQKKYDFNDSRIYKLIVEKKHVSKNSEYVEFSINKYEA